MQERPASRKLGVRHQHRLHSYMSSHRLDSQPDLFASSGPLASEQPGDEAPPAEFVDRIRTELLETLARARSAAALPWSDLTQALLAELRFKSIANWLPQSEADRLREDFETELVRLYAVKDAETALA